MFLRTRFLPSLSARRGPLSESYRCIWKVQIVRRGTRLFSSLRTYKKDFQCYYSLIYRKIGLISLRANHICSQPFLNGKFFYLEYME